MKAIFSVIALFAAVASAQEDRCDAPYPQVFCNTTEILQFESSDCKPYHVFLARGSDEPYPGRQGNITGAICSRLGGKDQCNFENIEYPAKSTGWGKEEWCKSAAKGAEAGQAQMRSFSQKCPNTKLILLGFSQGASVAQDILGGGGGKVFECEQRSNPPMDATKAPGSNIVAAVTFGAVARSRGQNFTMGEGVNFDGRRARTESQLAALNKFSGVLRDYCHYGDPMCAVGSKPENTWVHLDYFLAHNEEVTAWIADVAKKDIRPVSNSAGSRPSTQSLESSTVIAKSASIPTATPSIIAGTPNTPTNSLDVQSAQTGSAQKNSPSTGAAQALAPLTGYVSLVAAALFVTFGM